MKLEYLSMVFSISERLANEADSGFKKTLILVPRGKSLSSLSAISKVPDPSDVQM
jgi:hypothetical protein